MQFLGQDQAGGFLATLILLVLSAAFCHGIEPAKTTISDVVYRADGTPAAGTLLITWPAFTTFDGKAVAAGNKSLVLGAGGTLTVQLVPNAGATPEGTYYKVVLKLSDGTTSNEYWTVPATSPTNVAAIRASIVPSSVAAQLASRSYVDAALSSAVLRTGDQTVAGVKSFAASPVVPDPSQGTQAANKDYVDFAVANGGSGSSVLSLVKGGTARTTWISGRCVRVSDDGTKLEPSSSDCGGGNATSLAGNTWAAPAAIGSTTPNTGAFTLGTFGTPSTLDSNLTQTYVIGNTNQNVFVPHVSTGTGADGYQVSSYFVTQNDCADTGCYVFGTLHSSAEKGNANFVSGVESYGLSRPRTGKAIGTAAGIDAGVQVGDGTGLATGTTNIAATFNEFGQWRTTGTLHYSYGLNLINHAGLGDTRNAAVNIADQGTGSNDYSIYSAGGKNYLGGQLQTAVASRLTEVAAPSSPSSGFGAEWYDSTDHRLHDKNPSGVIGTTVVADSGASNNFLTAISAAGVISKAQPAFSNLSGQATTAQLPSTIDFTGKTSTAPNKTGTSPPGTCTVGDTFFDSDATAGQNVYGCTSTNTWTLQGDGAGGGGGGSGTINSGVTNIIPKYTASTTIDDSLLSDNGTVLSYGGAGGIVSSGSAAGFFGIGQGTTQGTSSQKIGLTAPTSVTAYNMVFPGAAGNGFLSWSNSSNIVTGVFRSLAATSPVTVTNADGTGGNPTLACATCVTSAASLTSGKVVEGAGSQATAVSTLTATVVKASSGTLSAATAGTDYVSPSSTETLTNKTLDAEGAGNTITTVSKVWMPAAGCAGTTGALLWDTLASNAPTATCSAGSTETTLMRGVADFPDSDGDYSLQQGFMLPSDWSGNIDLKFLWRAAATSGDVVWQATLVCRADAEVDDAAFNTASTVTDTAKGTTLQLNTATISAMTTTGCAAGEYAHLKVFRNRTNAADTIAGVISLAGVEVTLRRAQ